MEVIAGFHYVKCPFSRPGYFTGASVILGDTVTLVDTGTPSSPEEAIFPYLKSVNRGTREISHLVLTHAHEDHFGGVPALLKASGAKVYVHELGKAHVLKLAERTSFDASRIVGVKHGDILELSNRKIEIIHTPGHSADSICLVDRELGLCISGDSVQGRGKARPLLFYSSVAYTNSMQRLSQEPIDTLMMGHPFPPFDQGVVRGGQVAEILRDSLQAVEEIKNRVVNVLETAGRPLSFDDIMSSGLFDVREISIEVVLEDLAEDGKVKRIGKTDDLLWLVRR